MSDFGPRYIVWKEIIQDKRWRQHERLVGRMEIDETMPKDISMKPYKRAYLREEIEDWLTKLGENNE